ncbi:hypothetical protein TMLG_00772, partial [Mycobacterium tuberculosis SUMu012]
MFLAGVLCMCAAAASGPVRELVAVP